jgi:hypothetical protein
VCISPCETRLSPRTTCNSIPTSKNSRTPKNPIRPQRKPQRKTTFGSRAVASMSRFSNDIVTQVSNRYSSRGGMIKLASDVSRLMSTINTEDKSIVLAPTAVVCSNTSSVVTPLPTIAQGITSSTRTGDSVLCNRIDAELFFQYSGTAASALYAHQHFRWWIVRYKKTPASSGATAFPISEFLQTDANGNYTPLSQFNTDTNENFQVMVNGEVDLTLPTLATVQLTVDKTITIRHSCHFHQEYNGAAATNICDNMCFMIVVCSNPANVGGTCQITPSFRLWYIDN